MKAYRKDLEPSEFTVKYNGREFYLLGCTCLHCDYSFFVPAISEHEPSYCPNCGVKFIGVDPPEKAVPNG